MCTINLVVKNIIENYFLRNVNVVLILCCENRKKMYDLKVNFRRFRAKFNNSPLNT